MQHPSREYSVLRDSVLRGECMHILVNVVVVSIQAHAFCIESDVQDVIVHIAG